MTLTLHSAIAVYGRAAKAKLAAAGEPEEQLRTPLETLLLDMAELAGLPRSAITSVGESSLSDLKTRPDYAVTKRQALVGFVEVKAPGKGADPRRYKNAHDKQQWEKLQSLPNLIYTDGNEFSLWHGVTLVYYFVTDIDIIVYAGILTDGRQSTASDSFAKFETRRRALRELSCPIRSNFAK